MTQEMSADDPVTGWVETFRHDRGFGFVSPMLTGRHPIIGNAGQVFIHTTKCHAFAGTPELPGIAGKPAGSEWVKRNVIPGRGPNSRRNGYSYVIMDVVAGSNGKKPTAASWAVIPRRYTVEDVLQFGGLSAYMGTEVAVLPVKQTPGDGLWGVLTACTLSTDRIELTLSSAHGPGHDPVQFGTRTVDITFHKLGVPDDDPGRLTLRLYHKNGPERVATDVVCWRRPPH